MTDTAKPNQTNPLDALVGSSDLKSPISNSNSENQTELNPTVTTETTATPNPLDELTTSNTPSSSAPTTNTTSNTTQPATPVSESPVVSQVETAPATDTNQQPPLSAPNVVEHPLPEPDTSTTNPGYTTPYMPLPSHELAPEAHTTESTTPSSAVVPETQGSVDPNQVAQLSQADLEAKAEALINNGKPPSRLSKMNKTMMAIGGGLAVLVVVAGALAFNLGIIGTQTREDVSASIRCGNCNPDTQNCACVPADCDGSGGVEGDEKWCTVSNPPINVHCGPCNPDTQSCACVPADCNGNGSTENGETWCTQSGEMCAVCNINNPCDCSNNQECRPADPNWACAGQNTWQSQTSYCQNICSGGGNPSNPTPTPNSERNTYDCAAGDWAIFSFQTCPTEFTNSNGATYFGRRSTQNCTDAAIELGCYRTCNNESGSCDLSCSSGQYTLFQCPGENFTPNMNCTQGGTSVSGFDQFEDPYCGVQQIDCNGATGGFVGKYSTNGCNPSTTPAPTSPPGGGTPPSNNSGTIGGKITCDESVSPAGTVVPIPNVTLSVINSNAQVIGSVATNAQGQFNLNFTPNTDHFALRILTNPSGDVNSRDDSYKAVWTGNTTMFCQYSASSTYGRSFESCTFANVKNQSVSGFDFTTLDHPLCTPQLTCNDTCTTVGQACGDGSVCQSVGGQLRCRDEICPSESTCTCPPPAQYTCIDLEYTRVGGSGEPTKLGQQATFTCQAGPGTSAYFQFQYRHRKVSTDSWSNYSAIEPSSAGSATSVPFTFTNPGEYQVQCRACQDSSGTTCTAWETLN